MRLPLPKTEDAGASRNALRGKSSAVADVWVP